MNDQKKSFNFISIDILTGGLFLLIGLMIWPLSCTTQSGVNSINPVYFTDQVEIDGCEYIVINGANGRDIEHKFNCKNREHYEEK